MASNEQRKVPRRIAQTLINALKGGVVPRVGLPYITVGRRREIEALLSDVDMIAEGGASFRFIMGRYGSGKSFLLQTLRSYVMAKNFVVVDADLSPERRLQGTRGQGLATYRELIRNMATKTEARHALGVNIIITDDDWYEYLKLFAAFLRQAGYAGMLIFIDELVNIYKIPHAITRQYNYEKILTMYNDAMQGRAKYLGMVLCGTPACMEDTRRGVYSYEALRSRLAEGRFAGEHRDLLSPVIKLSPLTHEEMLVLVEKLSGIHAELYGYETTVTQEDLADFIRIEFGRIGADDHITPREVIRDFIQALDIIYQTPTLKMADLLLSENFSYAANAVEGAEVSAQFAEFDL